MLNVVCCIWDGEKRRRWSGEHRQAGLIRYANAFYRGVQRNLSLEHRFICFAGPAMYEKAQKLMEPGVEIRMLDSPVWEGNLPKLKAFDPAENFDDRVLIMDIDVVITGSLDDIAGYKGHLMTRCAWFNVKQVHSGGDVIAFRAGELPFWKWLTKSPEWTRKMASYTKKTGRRATGNERLIYREYYRQTGKLDCLQKLYPGQLYSYKQHARGIDKLPENCRLVSFHGERDIVGAPEKWIKKHWL